MTCRQGWRLVDGLAGALGMPLTCRRRARFSPRRCRTKHLPLLRLEEPPCIEGKLSQLDPFFRIGVGAIRSPLLVVAVHDVNPPLKPVMLGTQADEGCLLQAAWVEVRGLLALGRPPPWTQSRHEVGRLSLRTTAGRDRGAQRVAETRGDQA